MSGNFWGDQEQYDAAFMAVLKDCGKIRQFLECVFSFLSRRTDFFIIMEHEQAEMGFAPGVAMNMVVQAFKKYEILTRKKETELMREVETRRIDMMTDDLSQEPKVDVPSSTAKHMSKLARLQGGEGEDTTDDDDDESTTSEASTTPPTSLDNPPPEASVSEEIPEKPTEEVPVPQPEVPAPQPEVPAPQPEVPAPQPEVPAPQPEVPAPQPEVPEPPQEPPKPVIPKPPQQEMPKPISVERVPIKSFEKPTTTSEKLSPDKPTPMEVGANQPPPTGGAEGKSNKEEQLMQPDTYNGSSLENYSWSQTMTDIDIKVPVPEGTSSKNIRVEIKTGHLKVEVVRPTKMVILDGPLLNKIKAEDSMWSYDSEVKAVMVNLEKGKEIMWKSVFEGEEGIDLSKVDTTRNLSEFDEEAQAAIERVTFDHHMKMLGKPTSSEKKAHDILKKAWDAPGSPFKGTPFDPSRVNIAGVW